MINFKKKIKIFFFIFFIFFILDIYNNLNKNTVVYNKYGTTMGTTYSIKFIDNNNLLLKKRFNYIKIYIKTELNRLNELMSTYKKSSFISIINKNHSSINNKLLMDTTLNYVMIKSILLSLISQKIFNISMDKIIAIWGFDKFKLILKSPSIIKINNILHDILKFNTNYIKIILKKKYCNNTVNLSGSAKGYGVDQLYKIIRFTGNINLLTEIGGELKVSGLNKLNSFWILGILLPIKYAIFKNITTVKIYNKALATSGVYLHNLYFDKMKFSHIINTKTGIPVKTNLISISVITTSCFFADIIGTISIISNFNNIFYITKHKCILLFIYCFENYLNYNIIKISF